MSKGSKTRPTNKIEFDKNYDAIFGRKYTAKEAECCDCSAGICRQEKETFPYCGNMTNNLCKSPQSDCEQAINKIHGA